MSFEELRPAYASRGFPKLTASYARNGMIVLDDWGLANLHATAGMMLEQVTESRGMRRDALHT